jgi:hypothetical protein
MKSKDALDCLDLNVLVLIGYFLGHKTEVQSSSQEREICTYCIACARAISKKTALRIYYINLTRQRLQAAQDSQNDQDAAEDSQHKDKNVKGSKQLKKKVGSSGN